MRGRTERDLHDGRLGDLVDVLLEDRETAIGSVHLHVGGRAI